MKPVLPGVWVRAKEGEAMMDSLSYELAVKGREKAVLDRPPGRGKPVQVRGPDLV